MLKLLESPMSGSLLIPQAFLPDPNFSRSVVFLVEHHEAGSLGFTLNRPTDYHLEELIPEMASDARVWNGGPVQMETLHWLHRYPDLEDSREVIEGVYWGGQYDALKQGMLEGHYRAEDLRFFQGYSGWAEGQLQDELEEGSWLLAKATQPVIFNPFSHPQQLWKTLMKALGGDYALLANAPEKPWMN
jgi:putative transcriptional regulator